MDKNERNTEVAAIKVQPKHDAATAAALVYNLDFG